MKCPKCNTKNIKTANYCMDCHYEFSDEERDKAYRKTIYYYIEKIEDIYDKVSFEFITEHIAFKILSVLLILGIGIFNLMNRGIHTTIQDNNQYELYYYEKANTYYLLVDDSKENVDISLYIPNRLKQLKILHKKDNEVIDSILYQKKKGLKLKPCQEDYYEFQSTYSHSKKEQFQLVVYRKSDIKK